MASVHTIAAIATPPGIGGVGIVRVSGPLVKTIAQAITATSLQPRYAHYGPFYDEQGEVIDKGLALFFSNPHSFTGEDILELQGHGGMVVLDQLLQRVVTLGAVLAAPGEFSQRAYLNGKMDLVQAEATLDLIHASTSQAAKAAMASLSGVFSDEINNLLNQLIALRKYVEAAIDFPEEEIDFLADSRILSALVAIQDQLAQILKQAQAGCVLQEGMTLALMGKPNAGKSSVLNRLAGRDSAIVSAVAGTTRDLLREHIQLDGLPLQLVDTAGLRLSDDLVEQEGIRRAETIIAQADKLLLIVDSQENSSAELASHWPVNLPLAWQEKTLLCRNKIDLSGLPPGKNDQGVVINLSAESGAGFDDLACCLKSAMGYVEGEGRFLARRRHLQALKQTQQHVEAGVVQLEHRAGELLAEELLLAQNALAQVTGEFSADDLLGEIFTSFCIGK